MQPQPKKARLKIPEGYRVTVQPDDDPDLSWLEQDHYSPAAYAADPVLIDGKPVPREDYVNPEYHETWYVVLQCFDPGIVTRENPGGSWNAVDSVCGCDLWAPTSNAFAGTFYGELPFSDLDYVLEDMLPGKGE